MKPFRDYELRVVLDEQLQKLQQRIERYSNDEILLNDIDILCDNCFAEFCVEPVEIGEEAKRDVKQAKIKKRNQFYSRAWADNWPGEKEYFEVDGVIAHFYYPYVGESILFRCQASTYTMSGYPNIDLKNGHIIFCIEAELTQDAGAITSQFQGQLKEIRSGLAYANNDAKAFNDNLPANIRRMLEMQKKKVEQFYSLTKALEVPMQKTDYAVTHVPVQKRVLPITSTRPKEQGYCIADKDYNDILSVLKHAGTTYERTPKSYRQMEEEDFRNMLLASLNAMFLGTATGETFRGKGKTDICVEMENRAAFIAECKMWSGAAKILESIEQLDGYLTWRDVKTALIFFVQRKDFLRILEIAKKTLEGLSIVRQVREVDRNELLCCFTSKGHEGILISMRVMLFDLYCEK